MESKITPEIALTIGEYSTWDYYTGQSAAEKIAQFVGISDAEMDHLFKESTRIAAELTSRHERNVEPMTREPGQKISPFEAFIVGAARAKDHIFRTKTAYSVVHYLGLSVKEVVKLAHASTEVMERLTLQMLVGAERFHANDNDHSYA